MAGVSVCQIPNCDNPVRACGLCGKHYVQRRRTGDPIAKRQLPPRKKRCSPVRDFFNKTVLRFDSDECLIWPFSYRHGYPVVFYGGKSRNAHRIICEIEHGPATEDKPQAVHSCGSSGCVNRRHLRWADQKINEADKIEHGTKIKGELCWKSKLSEDDVLSIRNSTSSSKELSKQFDVRPETINSIRSRRSWSWL